MAMLVLLCVASTRTLGSTVWNPLQSSQMLLRVVLVFLFQGVACRVIPDANRDTQTGIIVGYKSPPCRFSVSQFSSLVWYCGSTSNTGQRRRTVCPIRHWEIMLVPKSQPFLTKLKIGYSNENAGDTFCFQRYSHVGCFVLLLSRSCEAWKWNENTRSKNYLRWRLDETVQKETTTRLLSRVMKLSGIGMTMWASVAWRES